MYGLLYGCFHWCCVYVLFPHEKYNLNHLTLSDLLFHFIDLSVLCTIVYILIYSFSQLFMYFQLSLLLVFYCNSKLFISEEEMMCFMVKCMTLCYLFIVNLFSGASSKQLPYEIIENLNRHQVSVLQFVDIEKVA